MKVVLLGRFPQTSILSGPQKFAFELFNQLLYLSKESDIKVYAIDYFFKELNNSNFFTRFFGKDIIDENLRIFRFGWIRILLFLVNQKPDIIHIVAVERYIVYILLLRCFFSAKILVTFHSSLKYEMYKRKYNKKYKDLLLEKLLLRRSDRNVFVSQLLKNLFEKTYGITLSESTIIHNGCKPVSKPSITNKWDNPDKYNFVFYSGFNDNIDRGLDFLLDVFTEINNERFTLHIIGNRIDNDKRNIQFHSLMTPSEFFDFFIDKHFIIKSITFDSFPIFVLEAMNYSLIPIINNNAGISEIIDNKINGFIYNKKEELINILNLMLNNHFDLENISQKSLSLAKNYCWETIANQYLKEYELLIK